MQRKANSSGVLPLIKGLLLDVACKLENVKMVKGPPTVAWKDTDLGEKHAVTGSWVETLISLKFAESLL